MKSNEISIDPKTAKTIINQEASNFLKKQIGFLKDTQINCGSSLLPPIIESEVCLFHSN